MQLRGGGPGHLGQGGVGDVRGPGQLRGPQLLGLPAHPIHLVLGEPVQDRGRGVGSGPDDDEVPEPLQQILHEPARILPGADHPVHGLEDGRSVPRGEGVHHPVQQLGVGEAQQGDGEVVGDALRPGAAHQLIQHGQRIPHGPSSGAHHQRQHPLLDGDALLLAQVRQIGAQGLRGDQAEGVVVGAGADGAEDLGRLGGREDEFDVLRRLLHDLQQRVEPLAGDHVRLVDDEDLVAVPHGGEGRAFAQVTGVVHAAVGGGVHLDDVQRSRAVPGEVPAGLAVPARGGGGALGAVEAAGQDARGGGLAAAARPGEEVGVVDAVVPQRRHQGLGDVLLPDDVGERLRAVTAVQCGAHANNTNGWD
ncbi:Uncharacterised protein [Mycobacteroides abscessus subsp. abscessus]|nr:Uncharacterised protein [Mycobacteroides abscessus subsp. abscessus]